MRYSKFSISMPSNISILRFFPRTYDYYLLPLSLSFNNRDHWSYLCCISHMHIIYYLHIMKVYIHGKILIESLAGSKRMIPDILMNDIRSQSFSFLLPFFLFQELKFLSCKNSDGFNFRYQCHQLYDDSHNFLDCFAKNFLLLSLSFVQK